MCVWFGWVFCVCGVCLYGVCGWCVVDVLAALTAVDTTDGPEIQLLKRSLQKAERSAQERPIAVQLTQSEEFVERVRCRTSAACHSVVGLARVQELTPHSPHVPPPDVGTQVQSLQMVNQLQEERGAFTVKLQEPPEERPRARQRLSPSHVQNGPTPPMPTMVPMELSDWVQDRQPDMQDHLNSGNCRRMQEVTLQATCDREIAELTGGMVP